MHFGGYEVGKVHTQRLVITNTSRVSRRIHVVLPSTPFFRAECSRRGLVAPGMSERVDVEFCPTEHRYYYDCVRVHAEDDNLLVPLHAYPVMNETVFPSVIDFGLRAVGERHVKRVPLRCKVPIAFEFQTSLNATSGPFTVEPARGVVPANGEVMVTVRFAPTTLQTTVAEVVVDVSQFGSEPKTCRVRGTGFPSVARDDAIAAMHASGGGGDVRDVGRLVDGTVNGGAAPGSAPFRGARGAAGPRSARSRAATAKTLAATFHRDGVEGGVGGTNARVMKGAGALGGGAGGGDAFTEYVRSAGRRATRAELTATFALRASGRSDADADAMVRAGMDAWELETAEREETARGGGVGGGGGGLPGGGGGLPGGGGGLSGGGVSLSGGGRPGGGAKPPGRAPPPGSGPGPRGRRVRVAATTKTKMGDGSRRPRSAESTDSGRSDSEDSVDGVRVPRRLRGAADVAYVLGQRRGKLRAKDLRRAIAAKDATRVASETASRSVAAAADAIDAIGREVRRKRLAKALRGETLSAEERGGGAFAAIRDAVRSAAEAAADAASDPSARSENRAMAAVDDPTLEPEVRELIFEREFQRVARYEKTKAWTNCVAVGEEPTGEGERAAVARRRAARDDVVNAIETAAAVARLAEGRRLAPGASYVVETEEAADRRAESGAVTSAEDGSAEDGSGEDRPTFNVNAADTWETRREALDRFVQAGRRVVLRNRAERRLRGIRTLMAAVGDKSRASAYVARDLMGAASGAASESESFGGSRSNDAEVREPARMTPTRVRDFAFPALRESRFRAREPVDLAGSEIREWDDPRPMPLRVPPAWRSTGHAFDDGAAKPPALDGDGYPPKSDAFAAAAAAGAEEESSASAPRPRGVPDPRADGALPSAPRANSAPPRPIPDPSSVPSSSGTRLVCFAPPRDVRRAVRAATYGFDDSLALEPVGYGAVAALANVETLTDTWKPRREAWSLGGAGAGAVPELMSGPDAEDLLEDEDGEGFGGTGAPVPPPAVVPTDEQIRAEFGVPGGGQRADERGDSAETNERNVAEAALDERNRERRVALARRLAARADALNARVSDPKLRWEM